MKKNTKIVFTVICVVLGFICWIFGDQSNYNSFLVILGWLFIIAAFAIESWKGNFDVRAIKFNDVGEKIKRGTQKTFEWIFKIIFYGIFLIISWVILSAILTPLVASIGEGTFIIILLLFAILHNQEKLLDKS